MKVSTLLLFVSVFQVFATSNYAQSKKLTLSLQNKTISEALQAIEDQSEFKFFYNNQTVDVNQLVSLEVKKDNILEVLDQVLQEAGITYRIVGKQIALFPDSGYDGPGSVLQPGIVSGKVTDENGQPLPGVNISIKGATAGTVTNIDGDYILEVDDENAILIFSYVGYLTLEQAVAGRATMNIVLIEDITNLEEVVVIGYGSQRKVEVTSAVSTVKSDDFIKGAVNDAGKLLQGKVAGLTIGTPSGDPNAPSEIVLRGTATLYSSTAPLVLVDGIPGSLNTVTPEDIESIDVLKDGSAAAIYGTRGTNGVILITTRKPTGGGDPTIDFKTYVSTQSFVNLPEMLNAEQYRARLASGTSGFQDYGSETDWVEEISRKTPISQNYNLAIRGGNAKTNYIATLAYRNLQGVIITTENSTINGRIDVNQSMLNDKLKLNLNYINNVFNSSAQFDPVAFRSAVRYNPTSPVFNDDGTYFENFGPTENFNPVAMINETFGGTQWQTSRLSGSVVLIPIPDLRLKMQVSRSESNNVTGYGLTKRHYSTTAMGRNGYASKSDYQSTDGLIELTAEYSKSINSHKINVLGGYSYQDNIYQRSNMVNYDFPVGTYSYIDNIGVGNALKIGQGSQSSSKYASNLIGFFGRINYNYKEKYLLLASLRYEAASQLIGTEQPWGTFPAVSVGWRISEEEFLSGVDFLYNLKLRAGYGITGTSPDALFLGISRLGYSGSFLVNGEWVPSLVPISNPNPYLRWEEKKETNIGLDFGILKGRVNGSIDYYSRITDGLLFDYQVPSPPNLYKTTTANVGVMSNKGIEVLVNVIPVQTQKFTWNTSMTYSNNTNELVSLENDLYTTTNDYFDDGRTPTPIGDISHRIQVGEPIGNFWGYKVIDITDDGQWVYEDGDGNPLVGTPDPATDRKVIGNGLPKSYASWNNRFRYGNFDLEINMRGAFGFEIMNAQRMLHENPGFDNYNQLVSAYDKVFDKAVLSRDVQVDCNSYYVEKGDYWKIDNITFGFNTNFARINFISAARIYVSAQNVFTITGYKGMDPEVTRFGTTGSQRLTPGYDDREKYPTTRVFSIGLNITFN